MEWQMAREVFCRDQAYCDPGRLIFCLLLVLFYGDFAGGVQLGCC